MRKQTNKRISQSRKRYDAWLQRSVLCEKCRVYSSLASDVIFVGLEIRAQDYLSPAIAILHVLE